MRQHRLRPRHDCTSTDHLSSPPVRDRTLGGYLPSRCRIVGFLASPRISFPACGPDTTRQRTPSPPGVAQQGEALGAVQDPRGHGATCGLDPSQVGGSGKELNGIFFRAKTLDLRICYDLTLQPWLAYPTTPGSLLLPPCLRPSAGSRIGTRIPACTYAPCRRSSGVPEEPPAPSTPSAARTAPGCRRPRAGTEWIPHRGLRCLGSRCR